MSGLLKLTILGLLLSSASACSSNGGTGSSAAGSSGTNATAGSTSTGAGGNSTGAGGTATGAGGSAGGSSGGVAGSGGSPVGGTAGDGAAGGTSSAGSGGMISDWRTANLTNFESYPDPGSVECIQYNGCMWAGQFAGVDGVQPESWVEAHNIVAVHSKDFDQYKLKTLRLRMETDEIDVTVYDMCADSDCDGCCTANSAETGFLIDIEKYTMQRFGHGDGIVQWACLDCN